MSTRLPGEKRSEEIDLEKAGDIYALQKYRWHYFQKSDPVIKSGRMELLLGIEVALRENTQHEVALNEKIRQITDHSASLIQGLQDEVLKLAKEYWFLERQWWITRASFRDSTLTRGIELWRSHPKWYMHHVLREDCVGRGGCCGRNCGCCSNRQNTLRKFAIGHCTVECSCCERARGFELDPEQKAQIQETFKLELAGPHPWYYCRIRLASFMGLMSGIDGNPFDFIDEPPPRYVPTTTS